jgi:hypothetical protein
MPLCPPSKAVLNEIVIKILNLNLKIDSNHVIFEFY